ncbi:MAG: type II toxin-antitoxin system VapC family toxin [bacterium]|nr:type II toxin-antitoxin system VapC family toxin [bacterium]
MIVYFDTSAIIPLIIDEPGSPLCERFWNDATQAVSSRLLYVEARAALARAQRLGRLSLDDSAASVESLDEIASEIASVEVTEGLVRTAGRLAEEEGLRGYDAVHLAAALAVAGTDTVFISGDRELLAAAARLGLAVAQAG